MPSAVPHRFLFRYSLPVAPRDSLPGPVDQPLDLPPEYTLPDLSSLDGETAFGEIRVAWNPGGLGLSVTVRGKQHPPVGDLRDPAESDGLQVWIDTRNTQSIHRASRFCHHFCLLPNAGTGRQRKPVAVQLPIARAREDSPLARRSDIRVEMDTIDGGYRLAAWLPAKILYGFDVEASPRLGFYYYLRDSELGDQFLTVGHEFPFAHDPSLWTTLELVPPD